MKISGCARQKISKGRKFIKRVSEMRMMVMRWWWGIESRFACPFLAGLEIGTEVDSLVDEECETFDFAAPGMRVFVRC